MRNLFLLVLFIAFSEITLTHAQTINDIVDLNLQNHALFTDKIKNVKGSAFLDGKWSNAIIFKKGSEFKFPAKYDVVNQIIWIKQDEKEWVLNPTSFDQIIFDYVTLITINGILFEPLEEGKFTLLIKHEKELKKASSINDSGYGSSELNTDQLVDKKIFYIKLGSNLNEIKNKKSLESISENSKPILNELKTNLKKKEDLIEFVRRQNK